jgi:hypothetical protein
MKSRSAGSTPLIIVIIVVSVILLGVLGFVFWQNFVKDKTIASSDEITSFEDCKKQAGNKILETYPEQCVTRSGKTFTGPTNQVAVNPGVEYCTTGEKLCFKYPVTWAMKTESTASVDNPGFNGDKLTLTSPSGKLTLHLQSGIDGIGGTCGPDGTLTRVLESTAIAGMTGFKADEYGLESAYVTKVITSAQDDAYTPNLYVSNSRQYTTAGDITEISGLCFSTLLTGRNVTLSNDYVGSGAFVFGLFGNSVGPAPSYSTIDEATKAYDTDNYVAAAAILASLHYQ